MDLGLVERKESRRSRNMQPYMSKAAILGEAEPGFHDDKRQPWIADFGLPITAHRSGVPKTTEVVYLATEATPL